MQTNVAGRRIRLLGGKEAARDELNSENRWGKIVWDILGDKRLGQRQKSLRMPRNEASHTAPPQRVPVAPCNGNRVKPQRTSGRHDGTDNTATMTTAPAKTIRQRMSGI